jgi:hypothetical protein
VLHLRCFFGWAATPAVFQVFSRIFKRLLGEYKNRLEDWFMWTLLCLACSPPLECAESDRSVKREITIQLMGSDSVAENKLETGRRVDFVGWDLYSKIK